MSWTPKYNVVVPVDFSEGSLTAVCEALKMVKSPSYVYLIHVLPELTVTEPGVIWQTVDDQSRREHATDALQEKFSDPQYEGIQMSVAIGDPGHEITKFAEGIGSELVVLPSHGRTGISRLLLGSVAERVVRLAHCPVLVLKN